MKQRKQSGFVLILTLIILVALSLVAIPAMRAANINMKIISNEANRDLLRNRVHRAVEVMVNDASGTTYTVPITHDIVVDGQNVKVAKPECISAQPASGYSVNDAIPPEDTIWEVVANAKSTSGSSVTVVQGLKIRMLAGSCV